MEPRKAEIYLEYQNYIDGPPVSPEALYKQSCSNDEVTITSWRDTWIGQMKKNKETFGSFKEHGIGLHYEKFKHKPCIIVGSGPSLRYNAADLVNKGDIPVISCLHNFHYLEDLGVDVDFYVTLDAGPVTIEEVSEEPSSRMSARIQTFYLNGKAPYFSLTPQCQMKALTQRWTKLNHSIHTFQMGATC